MKIEKTEVAGIQPSLRAMRNPMNSWSRSDTFNGVPGPNDIGLSQKLTKAGTEHCKHLRMIQVWVDLELPRYVWSEMDTYIFNTKVSCSTMHKITSRLLTQADFELPISEVTLNELNQLIKQAQETSNSGEKKALIRIIKSRLPDGFLQKRTVNFNYAELLNIYWQRKNHKLPEWHIICDWILSLPYFKELTGVE